MTKRALIVDDYRPVRTMLRTILAPLAFEIDEFDDGLEAIAHVKTSPTFDVMFLDIYMPGIDGLSVLQEIQEKKNSESFLVIMCSTDANIDVIKSALELGADEYVMKPFSAEDVQDKLRRLHVID